MAEDPFSSFLGGWMQSKELERQRMVDTARVAMEKQQAMMEQRRLNIEQQRNEDLARQAQVDEAIRRDTEEERRRHDIEGEKAAQDRIEALLKTAGDRINATLEGIRTRAATQERGQDIGFLGRYINPIVSGGGTVQNTLETFPYAMAMLHGDVPMSAPQPGALPGPQAAAAAPSGAATPPAAPTTRGPAAPAAQLPAQPAAGPGPGMATPGLNLPQWMTQMLPKTKAQIENTQARTKHTWLTNQQLELKHEIDKTAQHYENEYRRARAANMISIAKIHEIEGRYTKDELDGKLAKMHGEIAAEAALTVQRYSSASNANADAALKQKQLDDIRRAGGYTRYYQTLHNIDPQRTKLKEATDTYIKDRSAYGNMLVRYQMLQKRAHELVDDVNKYAAGEEKDDAKHLNSSTALTEILSTIKAQKTQMEQTEQAVEFDRRTVKFWEANQQNNATGTNPKDTKDARDQGKKDLKPPKGPPQPPKPPPDKPAGGGGFPTKPNGAPDFTKFSKQQLIDWYRTHH